MSLAKTMSEHRRLSMLKHLSTARSYTSNASILEDVCNGVGVPSTRSQVVSDLEWLEEVSLVTLSRSEDFVVATATGRGCDVSMGRIFVDGVKRPRAGD